MKEVRAVSKPEIEKAGSQECMDVFSGSTMLAPSLSLKEVAPMVQFSPSRPEEMGADRGF